MKIDDATGKLANLPPAVSSGGRAVVEKSNDTPSSTGSADKVSLSGTIQSLSSPGETPVDMNKVEAIRAAIADGSFRPDASRIADGMIASSRELLETDSDKK